MTDDLLTLEGIAACFEGLVPATIATASCDGVANVTHLSRVFYVDRDHVALSNQFFSKTTRNLAENPFGSVLLVHPVTYAEYRLDLRFERTERRGPLFDRIDRDIESIAALTGMAGVFKLRAVDIYRVESLEQTAGKSVG